MQLSFFENSKEKFLYFDTETTDMNNKEILQLAIIRDDTTDLNLYFQPKGSISFTAMAVHHITPEMLEGKPTFEEATYEGIELKDYLEKLAQEYIWVAHNAEFDSEVLANAGIQIPKIICTFKLARDLLSIDQKDEYDLDSYSLQFLRYYLGLYKNENLNHNTAHDALSDVYFLRDLFLYLTANCNLTTEKMLNITQAPTIIRNLHYGKHAGKSIKDIQKEDPSYLTWVLENWDDKPDVTWNVQRVIDSIKE